MKAVIHQISGILGRLDLAKYLMKSDLKVRYKNKSLGFLWAVLDPFFMMLIYIILVSVVFKRGGPQYPVLLFSALLSYRWFTFSTGNNVGVLLKNSKLLQTVKFPFSILIMNEVNIGLFNYLLGLVVLAPMLFIFEANITIHLLWLPLIILIQYFFTFGIGLLVSVAGLYFRDLQHILMFVLRIVLYLSPALYELSFIPEKYTKIYLCLNPFASLFDTYKNILVKGAPPNMYFWVFVGFTIVLMLWGNYYFTKKENNFAKDV
ncbi:MAG: ABC transporter permease [Flavobacteriales bacterium]